MSEPNPYAAPATMTPEAAGQGGAYGASPDIYNPNAAANWSLLFTPVLGSFLHWKNWKAIGEDRGLGWLIGSVLALIPSMLVPGVGILYLFVWYFVAVKAQVKCVEERWGKNYNRKSLVTPVLVAAGVSWLPVIIWFAVGGGSSI